MASLTVKNIPDNLYEHLKQAASIHHRSINSEIIVCLEKALLPTKATPLDLKNSAQRLREKVNKSIFTIDDIDAAKQEGRA